MSENKIYNIEDIMNFSPHRYPFLLVDRLEVEVPGEKGIGIKNVTMNEEFFQGHFPGNPVMPGVLQIEAMAQTAGALVVAASGENAGDKKISVLFMFSLICDPNVLPGRRKHSDFALQAPYCRQSVRFRFPVCKNRSRANG